MARLISSIDPHPVGIERHEALGPFLILADHAGNAVPKGLNSLGLPQSELDRHIGIDIGILGVSQHLSRWLNSTLIHQRYSRLVIDCNRPPDNPTSMMPISDGTLVPGNAAIHAGERQARIDEIFMPYHATIDGWIEQRIAKGEAPVVVAMHSFTPKHGDYPAPRPWPIGVLFNRDDRLARFMIRLLEAENCGPIGINQPYGVDDENDYAVPRHCEARGLVHVEFEIRQDLISTDEGQRHWATVLARLLPQALRAMPVRQPVQETMS
jgi:predicted N-formylglutamate amidohydrolase